jgi:hypothetical protein
MEHVGSIWGNICIKFFIYKHFFNVTFTTILVSYACIFKKYYLLV